jgi:hypothetical protein
MKKGLLLGLEIIKGVVIGALIGTVLSLLYMGYVVTHPGITAIASSKIKGRLSPVVRLTTDDGRTYCTAVVVTPHTAVTAGHCIVEAEVFGMMIIRDHVNVRPDSAADLGIVAAVSSVTPQLDQATILGDFRAFEARPIINDIAKLDELLEKKPSFISCGYPLGSKLVCSKTILQDRFNFMWRVRGLLLPGMSGGPTFLEDGTVVGTNDAVKDNFSIIAPTYNTPIQ